MAQPSEQFQGDMSRNEVEIDLNKFMAMVSEIGELKATIMEMEMSGLLDSNGAGHSFTQAQMEN